MNDPTEPVTIHTLAAAVAKFKALKEATNKAMRDVSVEYDRLLAKLDDHGRDLDKARKALADFAEALDAGLSTPRASDDPGFDGAGASAGGNGARS